MTAVSVAVQAEAASAARAHDQRITVDDLARAMQTSRARAREITDAIYYRCPKCTATMNRLVAKLDRLLS